MSIRAGALCGSHRSQAPLTCPGRISRWRLTPAVGGAQLAATSPTCRGVSTTAPPRGPRPAASSSPASDSKGATKPPSKPKQHSTEDGGSSGGKRPTAPRPRRDPSRSATAAQPAHSGPSGSSSSSSSSTSSGSRRPRPAPPARPAATADGNAAAFMAAIHTAQAQFAYKAAAGAADAAPSPSSRSKAAGSGSTGPSSSSAAAAASSTMVPRKSFLKLTPEEQARAAATATLPPGRVLSFLRTATGGGGSSRRVAVGVCQMLPPLLASRGYTGSQVVAVVAALGEARCRTLPGASDTAGQLAAWLLDCGAAAGGGGGGLLGLGVGARRPAAVEAEVPGLLPRLLPALAAAGHTGEEVWSAACRLMQTHIRTYSGDQLASLVAALVALDQEDSSGSTSGSSNSSSSSSSSGSGSGFLGVRQLEHPAMQGRLQALARDGGGISGDGAAGVLLGLVVSGAAVPADQLAALVGRALQGRGGAAGASAAGGGGGLTPGGRLQLLEAVSRYSERLPAGPTELVTLLGRYQPGLLEAVVAGLEQEAVAAEAAAAAAAAAAEPGAEAGPAVETGATAAAGAAAAGAAPPGAAAAAAAAGAVRLRPDMFTAGALSLCRLRWWSGPFFRALAAALTRGMQCREVEVRDVVSALYVLATFGGDGSSSSSSSSSSSGSGSSRSSSSSGSSSRSRGSSSRGSGSSSHSSDGDAAAFAELFAAAADFLSPRLQGGGGSGSGGGGSGGGGCLAPANLSRVAWVYAVAGACGLLPTSGRARRRVDGFLEELVAALRARGVELSGSSPECRGMTGQALRVWAALRPQLLSGSSSESGSSSSSSSGSSSCSTPGAGRAPAGSGHKQQKKPQGKQQQQEEQEEQQPPQGRRRGGGSVDEGGAGAAALAALARSRSSVSVSELQRGVWRQLRALGYDAQLEKKVKGWSVDIWLLAAEDGGVPTAGAGSSSSGNSSSSGSTSSSSSSRSSSSTSNSRGALQEGGAGASRRVAVAVEVDGPWHFTTSQPVRLLGTSRARDAALRALGLVVVGLDYRELPPPTPPPPPAAAAAAAAPGRAGQAGRAAGKVERVGAEEAAWLARLQARVRGAVVAAAAGKGRRKR